MKPPTNAFVNRTSVFKMKASSPRVVKEVAEPAESSSEHEKITEEMMQESFSS